MTAPQPWERLERETAKAFQAFQFYRDLPIGGRTIKAAWDLYQRHVLGKEKLSTSIAGHFKGWATHNAWQDRALAWDEERDRQRREANVAGEIGEMEAFKAWELQKCTELETFVQRARERLEGNKAPRAHEVKLLVDAYGTLINLKRRAMGLPGSISDSKVQTDIPGLIQLTHARGAADLLPALPDGEPDAEPDAWPRLEHGEPAPVEDSAGADEAPADPMDRWRGDTFGPTPHEVKKTPVRQVVLTSR